MNVHLRRLIFGFGGGGPDLGVEPPPPAPGNPGTTLPPGTYFVVADNTGTELGDGYVTDGTGDSVLDNVTGLPTVIIIT